MRFLDFDLDFGLARLAAAPPCPPFFLFGFFFGGSGKSAQSRAPSSIQSSSSFGSHDTTQPGRLFAQSIVATAVRTAGGKLACSATDHARTRCR